MFSSRPSRDIYLRHRSCSRRVLPLLPTLSQTRSLLYSRLLTPSIHLGWHLQGAHCSPTQAIDLSWGGTVPHSKASRPYSWWLILVHSKEQISPQSHLPRLVRAYITFQKLCATFLQPTMLAQRVCLQVTWKVRWLSQNSINLIENAHGVSVNACKLDIILQRWDIANRAEVEVIEYGFKRLERELPIILRFEKGRYHILWYQINLGPCWSSIYQ